MTEAVPARPGPAGPPGPRPAWVEVDVGAVRHNAALLGALCAPARLCAVVKADGYGHGAVAVATAALEAGASWLAVALVEEGAALRRAGVEAPVLLLSEPPPEAMEAVVAERLTPTVYTRPGVQALADAARQARRVVDAHVKVDTGMHRVGADPEDTAEVVGAVVGGSSLRFAGLWTHLAVADGTLEEDRAFTDRQLDRLDDVRAVLADAGLEPQLLHAANSAGALCHPRSRLDMVRCGIALYGLLPSPALAPALDEALAAAGVGEGLRPALSFKARVSMVRVLEAGERPSYGRRYPLPETSVVATVPVGYADGVPRRYFEAGGTVLVGGRRRPLAGTVTMDQVMVDCGPDPEVRAGDEVVLIGSQGDESLSAWDWAGVLDTIAYEVVCGIGPRVPRVVTDSDSGGPGRAAAAAGRLTDRIGGDISQVEDQG